ncbi:MAG: hypothetical protein COA42_22935 [Alteromonadaceae bacterium]|nr:MAG: hypothetical protein COA42_22935 [Alteromonadaceae bacterium]
MERPVSYKKLFICSSLSLVLLSCNTANIKQNIGAGVGAIVGAGLGNVLCDDSDSQDLCTVAGLVVGGYIGAQIGKHLDEKDRARHAKATQDVLLAQKNGASSSWENEESGTSGVVSVVEESKTTETAQIPIYKDKVEQVPALELIDQAYTTSKTVNIRTGPGTDYRKAPPALYPGEKFGVIGRVIDSPNWLMIEKNGAGSGFVYASLVEPLGEPNSSDSFDSDNANFALVDTETVLTCKVVKHEITYDDGEVETDTVEMCLQGDGSWNLV